MQSAAAPAVLSALECERVQIGDVEGRDGAHVRRRHVLNADERFRIGLVAVQDGPRLIFSADCNRAALLNALSLPGFGRRFDHTLAECFQLGAQLFADDRELLDGLQDGRERCLPLDQGRRRRPDKLELARDRGEFPRFFITERAHADSLAGERRRMFQVAATVEQVPPLRHRSGRVVTIG